MGRTGHQESIRLEVLALHIHSPIPFLWSLIWFTSVSGPLTTVSPSSIPFHSISFLSTSVLLFETLCSGVERRVIKLRKGREGEVVNEQILKRMTTRVK